MARGTSPSLGEQPKLTSHQCTSQRRHHARVAACHQLKLDVFQQVAHLVEAEVHRQISSVVHRQTPSCGSSVQHSLREVFGTPVIAETVALDLLVDRLPVQPLALPVPRLGKQLDPAAKEFVPPAVPDLDYLMLFELKSMECEDIRSNLCLLSNAVVPARALLLRCTTLCTICSPTRSSASSSPKSTTLLLTCCTKKKQKEMQKQKEEFVLKGMTGLCFAHNALLPLWVTLTSLAPLL